MARTRKRNGVSLAKGPAGILGLVMIALGVASYLSGADSFTADPFRGTVNGDTFLGLEANGWTSVLWAGAGALLLLAAPMHWGAKTMALTVAFALGACALLWVTDGDDALGIFAANAGTATAWAIAAGILALVALLPRVGKRRETVVEDRDRRHDRDVDVRDRDHAYAEQPTEAHERPVRDGGGDGDRERERFEREPEQPGATSTTTRSHRDI